MPIVGNLFCGAIEFGLKNKLRAFGIIALRFETLRADIQFATLCRHGAIEANTSETSQIRFALPVWYTNTTDRMGADTSTSYWVPNDKV